MDKTFVSVLNLKKKGIMEDMIKKLILVLALVVLIEYIVEEQLEPSKTKQIQKYEYHGKYKDPKRERIVEHIGE